MTFSYPLVFEQEESGAVSAYVPGLAVYAAADTRPKAEIAIREAVEAHLEALEELGRSLPTPASTVKVLRVAIRSRKAPEVAIVGPGALLASASSPAKAAAARRNGARGGRPRARGVRPRR
jgi:predicted RNase H-like HicB family nuclease